MPANPSHAGVKRLWRRPLLASHFDYKTHESTARRWRRPELSQTSNPKRRRLRRHRATLAAPATRPKVPTGRRKFARTGAPGCEPPAVRCRRPLERREISLFVKFELRRGGDAGGWGPEAVPRGPAVHATRSTPRQDRVCWGGRWEARSEPTCRPARDPRPQTSDWHLLSPRECLICCSVYSSEPRGAGAAHAPVPVPRDRGSLIKTGEGGATGTAGGRGDGNFWRPGAGASRSPPGRKALRPAA